MNAQRILGLTLVAVLLGLGFTGAAQAAPVTLQVIDLADSLFFGEGAYVYLTSTNEYGRPELTRDIAIGPTDIWSGYSGSDKHFVVTSVGTQTVWVNGVTGGVDSTTASPDGRTIIKVRQPAYRLIVEVVNQAGANLGSLGGSVETQGNPNINGVPLSYPIGRARYAIGVYTGVRDTIPNIDPIVQGGKTAQYDVSTHVTTYVLDRPSSHSRIQIVFSIADLTVKTVDENGVPVGGSISMPGVSTSGSATVPNYVSGQGHSLTALFSGTTYHAGDIDLSLYRPGHTIRVDAIAGALLAEGPALANDKAEIHVVYPALVDLTVQAVDQNGAPLSLANGFTVNGHTESAGNPTGGNPSFTITSFPSGSPLQVKGSYNGAGGGYATVTPLANKTIWVDGITGSVDSTRATPGQHRVNIRFTVGDLAVVAVDQNGTALVAGPVFPVDGRVELSGGASGNPTLTLDDFAFGPTLDVKGSYNGAGKSTTTTVTPQFGKTIWMDGVTGVVLTTTATPGQSRVNIRFTVVTLTLSVVDQSGQVLTSGHVEFSGAPSSLPTQTRAGFALGQTVDVKGFYGNYGGASTTVTPSLGQTVRVSGLNGGEIDTVPSENAGHAAGETRVDVVFTVADLIVSAVDQSGTLLSTDNLFPMNGHVQVSGGAIGDPSVTLPGFVIGTDATVKGSYNGITAPDFTSETIVLGHTVRVDGQTGDVINVVPSENAGHAAGETRWDVVFSVVPLTIEAVDQTGRALSIANGFPVDGHVETAGNSAGGNPTLALSGFGFGQSLNVKGSYNGVGMAQAVAVTPEVGKTIWINGITGAADSITTAPGTNRVNIRFTVANLTIEVVDQAGQALSTANGAAFDGRVELPGGANGNPTLPLPGFAFGQALSVKGTYNSAGMSTFFPVTPQVGKTTWMNGLNGAVDSVVTSPGSSRVNVRFAVTNIFVAVVDSLENVLAGGNLDRPGSNPEDGQPSYTLNAFLVGDTLRVNGRYLGFGLPQANFTAVFVQPSQTVKVDGPTGAISSVTPSAQNRVLVVFRTATLQVGAVDQTGMSLSTGNGFPMNGQVELMSPGVVGTGNPLLTLGAFPVGGSLNVRGSYNGAGFSSAVTVTPQVGRTIRVNGVTGAPVDTVLSQNAGHLAGETRVDIVFAVANVTVEAVDQNGVPLDSTNAASASYKLDMGHVEMPGNPVGGNPTLLLQGYPIAMQLNVKATFFGQGIGSFMPVVVHPDSTLRINGMTGALIGTDSTPGHTRIWFVFEPIKMTFRTIDQNGLPINGNVDIPGPPIGPSPLEDITVLVDGTVGVEGKFLGGTSGSFVSIPVVKGRHTTINVTTPWTDNAHPAVTSVSSDDGHATTETFVKFRTVAVTLNLLDKATHPLAPMPQAEVNVLESPLGFKASGQTYSVLDGGVINVTGRANGAVGTNAFDNGNSTYNYTTLRVSSGQLTTVDGTVTPAAVTSGGGAGSGATVNLLLRTNRPPTLTVPTETQVVDEGQELIFTVGASDSDAGQTATVSATGLPVGASFDASTNAFSWTPGFDVVSTSEGSKAFSVTFTATDGILSDTKTVSISVNNVNRVPSITLVPAGNASDPSYTVNEGDLLSFTVNGTDPDNGDVVTLSNVGSLPPGAQFTSGTFNWTPSFTQAGSYTVTFKAEDSVMPVPGVSTKPVTITVNNVNRAPTLAVPTEPQVVDEGQPLSFTVSAADPDGDVVTFVTTGLPAGATLSNGSNTVTVAWTPGFTQAGTYSVKFTATDNGSLSDGPLPVLITVSEVNLNPVVVNDATTTNEDTPVTVDVKANDTDADAGDVLSVTGVTNGTKGTASINPNGTVAYTPNANANGMDSFTYTISDGHGGTATGTVEVTITPVNDAPSFIKGADQTMDEDAGSQTVSGWAMAISEGPANESGQVVDFIVTSDNPGLFSAQPAVDTSGKLTYTTTLNANGTANVTAKIHDNGGTSDGGVDTSAPQAFKITVTPVNDPPVADAGLTQTVNENAVVTLHGSGTDADAGSVLGFVWTQVGTPAVTLTGATTASPTFRAPFVGPDQTLTLTFRLVVTDNGSPALPSQPSAVTVTVKDVYNAVYMSVPGASSIQKGLRDEDVFRFRRDDNGDEIDSTLVKVFDGSTFFKSNERLDGVEMADVDGDGSLELVFSVRTKASFKPQPGLTIYPGDLVAYYATRATNRFEKFLDGSTTFKAYQGKKEKDGRDDRDDKDRRDNDYKEFRSCGENIDAVAVYRAGTAWKIALSTTSDAMVGTFKFDKNDVVEFDYNPVTKLVSNPVKILDTNTLLKGKESNIDALDVVDDDGNGTFESVVFSTGSSEKLKDGRELKSSVLYLYNREAPASPIPVEELFNPVNDGLSRNRVQIGSVSFIGPIKPWGTGPKPAPASKKSRKGEALLAKVGEEVPAVTEILPEAFGLEQNYPNPFNPSTTIRYALPEAASVSLVIYNILGQQVRTLVNTAQGPGYHTVVWDGRDEVGRTAATGMYIYRIQAGTFLQTKKMLFAK